MKRLKLPSFYKKNRERIRRAYNNKICPHCRYWVPAISCECYPSPRLNSKGRCLGWIPDWNEIIDIKKSNFFKSFESKFYLILSVGAFVSIILLILGFIF